jgi:hypothetical protein
MLAIRHAFISASWALPHRMGGPRHLGKPADEQLANNEACDFDSTFTFVTTVVNAVLRS